jgi:molybdate transport system ATP-binding protein
MIDVELHLQRSEFQLNTKFSVPSRGVTAVFGPSGCGKTTLLRAIAGLEPDAVGSLEVNGQHWQTPHERLPVEARRVGLVFQHPSLFPHLTVEENLLYGRKRLEKATNPYDLKELILILGIEELLNRHPDSLSGGELQRVALGRALLAEPKLLLMDEPLSMLDQASRETLIQLLENFLQQLDIPIFYVTHSSEEVARLADNLVLLSRGDVTACGPTATVLASLDSELSRSESAFSVLQGEISSKELPGLLCIECSDGIDLKVPTSESMVAKHYPLGRAVRLRIRARDVSICLERPQQSSILNILPAVIAEISTSSDSGSRLIRLDIAGMHVLSKISEYSVQQLGLHAKQVVFAQIKSASLV